MKLLNVSITEMTRNMMKIKTYKGGQPRDLGGWLSQHMLVSIGRLSIRDNFGFIVVYPRHRYLQNTNAKHKSPKSPQN